MKRRSIIVIATLILLICIGLLINPFKKELWDTNLQLLESRILSDDLVDQKVNLTTWYSM